MTARDAFIAHRLKGLTASPNTTHDADGGSGGLHTGGLNDHPARVGGYSAMSGHDGQDFRQQFGKEFDGMTPEQQAPWHPDVQNAPSASSGASGTPGNGDSSFPVSTSPTPVAAGKPGFYGKIGPARPTDNVQTSGDGTQNIRTASGGNVTLPASQSQTPPSEAFAASNGTATGIYKNGVEQVKQPDGKFAPGQTKLPVTAGQPAATGGDPLSLAAGAAPPTDDLTAGLMSGSFPGSYTPSTSVASNAPAPAPSAASAPPALSLGTGQPAAPAADSLTGSLMKPPVAAGGFPGTYATAQPMDEDEEEGSTQAFPGAMPKPFGGRRRLID